MRIGIVTFNYHPVVGGGSGVYALRLSQELASLGHHVSVFVPHFPGMPVNGPRENLRLVGVPLDPSLPFPGWQYWLNLPRSVRRVEGQSPLDLVHFNGVAYWLFGGGISKTPKLSTIHHLVGDAASSVDSNLFMRFKDIGGESGFLMPFIERRTVISSDLLIAVSEYTKRQIQAKYHASNKRVRVVRNGIDVGNLSFTQFDMSEFRAKLDIPCKPVILFVGRLNDPRKGLDFLLESFAKASRVVDATLLIVGRGTTDGVIKMSHRLGISQKVAILGYVDDVTLRMCYSLSDVYVCPSRLEGFGLTILEAMAAGRPIVATKCGALPELVQNGVNGLLVDPQSTSDFASGIIEYITDKSKAEEVGNRNRLLVQSGFSWKECAIATERVYSEIVG